MVARFKVSIAWEPEYTKPVYLMVAGFSEGDFSLDGESLMVLDTGYALVQNGVPEVDLTFDMSGMDVISVPFSVGGYEDEPVAVVV